MSINWTQDKVNNEYRPTLYPGESTNDWSIPDEINNDFHRLNAIIENKYSKEFLKICAFFNKMFPSLRCGEYTQVSYNAIPFTTMDQERTDTGNGTNYNYLKQIVDQITSRLGTISFIPKLLSEEQSFEYIIYKDEVERVLRKFIKDDKLNRISIEAFHNAAILGYSHVFIDPYTGELIKANDYEVGIFESQLNRQHIKQMLYRNYSFPVTDILVYIKDLDKELTDELLESITGRNAVEFSMYFDCIAHKVYVTIAGKTLPPKEYNFDNVLITTFQWDTSFSKQLTSSMFDLLYPIQREINHIAAKKLQIIRMYKGSVPVFNSDCDLAMKAISNGSGEALYIDSARSTSELMTVINPTPLDPQLDAEITSHKTAMYELAGIQNASFDMENMRSAAAVVALDQTRDSVFQAQMAGMAQFIKNMLKLYTDFFAVNPEFADSNTEVDWALINKLISQSYIQMEPVHLNDPMSKEPNTVEDTSVDYADKAIMRVVLNIINGKTTFDTLPYWINVGDVLLEIAVLFIKFEALGIEVPMSVHLFMMSAYLEAVKIGTVQL